MLSDCFKTVSGAVYDNVITVLDEQSTNEEIFTLYATAARRQLIPPYKRVKLTKDGESKLDCTFSLNL